MEQDDQKRSDEEIKGKKEAQDSELSDTDLENVTGGNNLLHGGPTGVPAPLNGPN